MAVTDNIGAIMEAAAKEVANGLPNERDRIDSATVNRDFYDGLGYLYLPRRPAEVTRDYEDRSKRSLDLVTQGVDALCADLYQPPPTRTLESTGEADKWLSEVYADQLIDAKLHQADLLACTNQVCAVQIHATGDPERPIKFILWGADEFNVWTDPEDATKPVVIATIDRQDAQTRYKLWSDSEVRTYLTEKVKPGQTNGGRTAQQVGPTEAHGYGCLPFAFIHWRLPDRKFWAGCPGESLRRAQERIDIRLSQVDEAIEKYNLRPLLLCYDVDTDWRPVVKPGNFLHVPRDKKGKTIGKEDEKDPRVDPLQALVDVTGAWADLENFIVTKLESVGIPRSAVRMETTGVQSGIALMVESAPLLKHAMQRRPLAMIQETELAKVTLLCGGNHYGIPALVEASRDVRLSFLWPEPYIPIPDPARDTLDQTAIDMGLKSPLDICMQRFGMNEAQAWAHLERVAKDNERFAKLHPPAVQPSATPGATPPAATEPTSTVPAEPGPGEPVKPGQADA